MSDDEKARDAKEKRSRGLAQETTEVSVEDWMKTLRNAAGRSRGPVPPPAAEGVDAARMADFERRAKSVLAAEAEAEAEDRGIGNVAGYQEPVPVPAGTERDTHREAPKVEFPEAPAAEAALRDERKFPTAKVAIVPQAGFPYTPPAPPAAGRTFGGHTAKLSTVPAAMESEPAPVVSHEDQEPTPVVPKPAPRNRSRVVGAVALFGLAGVAVFAMRHCIGEAPTTRLPEVASSVLPAVPASHALPIEPSSTATANEPVPSPSAAPVQSSAPPVSAKPKQSHTPPPPPAPTMEVKIQVHPAPPPPTSPPTAPPKPVIID